MTDCNSTCATATDLANAIAGVPTNDDIDSFWLVINGQVVFLMQVGFMLLEVGAVRAQHAKAICVKNAVDFLVCTLTWIFIGYPLAFGPDKGIGQFVGKGNWFGSDIELDEGYATEWSFLFFQWTFTSATSTIVSGAGAERCSFKGYFLNTIMLSGIIYPAVVHWIWSGDAWLASGEHSDITFYDFAGSGVVHLVGGCCAFMFAYFVGPRDGRYLEDGTPQTIQPHNMVLSAAGVLLLVLGWFGFNGGSTAAASGAGAALAGRICVVSAIGAASGGLASFSVIFNTAGFIDLNALTNGMLAGLVSVTAGASVLLPWSALVSGLVGGVVYQYASAGMVYLHVDDPLDAAPIHGACGFWGLMAVGLFAEDEGNVEGLLTKYGGTDQIGYQIAGALVIMAWCVSVQMVGLGCLNAYKREWIRVPLDVELVGDLVLYGGSAYPQFEEGVVAPPAGHMSVVITDVQDSTALWEWNPEIMRDSIAVHEVCLRDNIIRFKGYEIMDEGDSLSIVFHDGLAGLNYCLSTQQDLMLLQWAEELYEHKSGSKQGKLYCGLRVRMAVHVGNGVKELNHSTNRLTYEGPVVNETAQLLKAVDAGGIVIASMACITDVQTKFSHKVSELPEFSMQDIGTFLLPKVEEPMPCVQIMPTELSARPWSTMSGCIKLANAFGEAPGVATPGASVAFVFCSLKLREGAPLPAAAVAAADGKKKRRSTASGGGGANAGDVHLADMLRSACFNNNGYTTKTAGGVSLLSFHNADGAFGFVKDMVAQTAGNDAYLFYAGVHCGNPTNVAPNKSSGRADYTGPPVNASARILALAGDKPEIKKGNYGVGISGAAYNDLQNKGSLASAGKFPLKGVSEPMEVYAYTADGAHSVRAAESAQ